MTMICTIDCVNYLYLPFSCFVVNLISSFRGNGAAFEIDKNYQNSDSEMSCNVSYFLGALDTALRFCKILIIYGHRLKTSNFDQWICRDWLFQCVGYNSNLSFL
jgi:hypothetical protein